MNPESRSEAARKGRRVFLGFSDKHLSAEDRMAFTMPAPSCS